MKRNYHTHTTRCHHANDCDEQYVRSAIRAGFSELGFSDHSPWKYNSAFIPTIRMELSEFDEYYQSIASLKEKYKKQINIKIGLECEYYPRYEKWLRQFVQEKQLDYIILGVHFDGSDEDGVYFGHHCNKDRNLDRYIELCKQGVDTEMYSYLAHPDLFMRGRKKFDAYAAQKSLELCEYCKQHNMPLEYNLEGMRVDEIYGTTSYPHAGFWKIAAQVGNDVIIGFDAHEARSLEEGKYYKKAIYDLEKLGMRIITQLPYRF